jgi:hypothetical protein
MTPKSVLLAYRILIAAGHILLPKSCHEATFQPIEKSPWVVCGLYLQELTVHQQAVRFAASTTTSPHLISNWGGSANLSHITKPIIIAVSLPAQPNRLPPSSPTSSTYNNPPPTFTPFRLTLNPNNLPSAPPPNPILILTSPHHQNDIRQRTLHFVHLPWQLCHAAHRPLPLPRGQRRRQHKRRTKRRSQGREG